MQTVHENRSALRIVDDRQKPGDVLFARPGPVTEGNAHISHAERFNQLAFRGHDKRIPAQRNDSAYSQLLKKLDSFRARLTAPEKPVRHTAKVLRISGSARHR